MKENAFLDYPGLEVGRRGIHSSSPEEILFPLFPFLEEEIRLRACLVCVRPWVQSSALTTSESNQPVTSASQVLR